MTASVVRAIVESQGNGYSKNMFVPPRFPDCKELENSWQAH